MKFIHLTKKNKIEKNDLRNSQEAISQLIQKKKSWFFLRENFEFSIVRTQLFSDPRMALGSYVKGPNNIIHREWARKAGP